MFELRSVSFRRDVAARVASLIVLTSFLCVSMAYAQADLEHRRNEVTGHVDVCFSKETPVGDRDVGCTVVDAPNNVATYYPAPVPSAQDETSVTTGHDGDGILNLAWKSQEPTGSAVYLARLDTVGGIWGDPVRASSPGSDAHSPDLAVDSTGTTWIVFEELSSGGPDITVVSNRPEDISILDSRITGSPTDGSDSRPSVHTEGGEVWVTWFDGVSLISWSERLDEHSWSAASSLSYADDVEIPSVMEQIRLSVLSTD